MTEILGLNLAGWALVSLAATCAVVSTLLTYQEIGEVNRKLPDREQIPYFFMDPGMRRRIRVQYTHLYPGGRIDFWRRAFQTAAFGFIALAGLAGAFLS
jgi:hypothetical protein